MAGGMDKFVVEIAFDGAFSIEIQAKDIGDAFDVFEDQDLREQIALDIGIPKITDKLGISRPWIRSITAK
jgi:hypothetical protein